jgi:hypothetical protein
MNLPAQQTSKLGKTPITELLEETAIKLFAYCNSHKWAGYDPFDGLNSRVFAALPFSKISLARLILTQVMKRMPVNASKLLLVSPSENPKGLAVFASALMALSEIGLIRADDQIRNLISRIGALRSPQRTHFCWGYNFDWQSRKFFLPKFAPNIICTTFVGNALLDAYYQFEDDSYLEMAISAGEFIVNGLNVTKFGNDEICFSYTPYDHGQVHNANLLGAAYLARLYTVTEDEKLLKLACKAINYSVRKQKSDGSWAYGEDKTQGWVDNFHTGYNLCALRTYQQCLNTAEFDLNVRIGFDFYLKHFFTEEGAPKYYHNRIYPIDVHSVAQSMVTLATFRDLNSTAINLADKVFEWAIANMWDEKGYFYYQITPYYKNRIPYMRWSQSWMLYAMALLLGDHQSGKIKHRRESDIIFRAKIS